MEHIGNVMRYTRKHGYETLDETIIGELHKNDSDIWHISRLIHEPEGFRGTEYVMVDKHTVNENEVLKPEDITTCEETK